MPAHCPTSPDVGSVPESRAGRSENHTVRASAPRRVNAYRLPEPGRSVIVALAPDTAYSSDTVCLVGAAGLADEAGPAAAAPSADASTSEARIPMRALTTVPPRP